MKLRAAIWIAVFLLGMMAAPLGVSGGLFMGIVLLCFAVIIITYYRAAWRQGHSGSAIIPLKRGPFGYDGLKLEASKTESIILVGCALIILGMFAGLVVAIGLE